MRISNEKKDRIIEQILHYLYQKFPYNPFTSEIAKEIARDEEYIKRICFELKDKALIIPIRKNNKGEDFTRRIRWRLSNKVYEVYSSKQNF